MLISRTPYRVTLGGGGTDIPPYDQGFCVAATITRFVFVAVNDYFEPGMLLHYSETERVTDGNVKHRLLREILCHTETDNIELSSMADVPSGTGLGSSSAFTVGALHALHQHHGRIRTHRQIAAEAAHIEIDCLGDPIGYQDQYACALGGLRWMTFDGTGLTDTGHVEVTHGDWQKLSRNLHLFYTGIQRATPEVIGNGKPDLDAVREQGHLACTWLEAGKFHHFARGLTEQWELKFRADPSLTHMEVDEWIRVGIEAGALGGKLVGAGNGGFVLFYADDPQPLIDALPLRHIPVGLEAKGVKVIAR